MAVKSIKLKLKTNSGPDALSLRKGLWKTHELINNGIAYYLEWLTLLRQEPIGNLSKDDLRLELIIRIQRQQQHNGYPFDSTHVPEEIFTLLRELYECIVPSSVRESGDAQMLSRKFFSPLVDPDSKGGEGESKAGRKPGWLLKKEAGDPDWEADYLKAEKRKEADPTAKILSKLREYGLKPLFPMFTNEQKDIAWLPLKSNQFVRTWDRDMFQQAIERLLSWESWNYRVKDEREELEQKRAKFEQENLLDADEWLKPLQQFEQDRARELESIAFAPVEEYVVNSRQIRGWKQLYDKWMKTEGSLADYLAKIAEVQTSMPKEFGDPVVFRFLAQPENHHIWRGHPDRLMLFSLYNQLKKRLSQAKLQANFTLPDPVEHPLWIRFDARDGNLHDYTLWQETNKTRSRRTVIFSSLVMPTAEGWEEKADIEVELAYSRQFAQQIQLKDNPKGKQEIDFIDYSSRIPLEGNLGGAKIQFDRRHLEKNKTSLSMGNIGPVFFNVVYDVEPNQPIKNGRLQTPIGRSFKVLTQDWPKVYEYKPAELEAWMKQTATTDGKGIGSLDEGMRVMTIDMGLRTSAAVSIFEIATQPPANEDKLFYKLPHNELYAVHQRSLLLNLPGELPDRRTRLAREARLTKRYVIRSQIRLLGQVQHLNGRQTEAERVHAIEEMLKTIRQYENLSESEQQLWQEAIERLSSFVKENEELWRKQVTETYETFERYVGRVLSQWKKSFGEGRRNLAGLSMWNIEELDSLRRILISWSKRSRKPGEVNRIQENERFAEHLLKHIQQVKDTRMKQMANLIVMTALGYKYVDSKSKWVEAYPACQVVLFENLQRYRFKQDRSRQENSQLMKWAHRSIPKMVSMQGEPFGLQVGDVSSAYSSRFHARTGAPGIRCHAVTEKDIDDPFFQKRMLKKGFLTEEEWRYLKPGDLVPMQGGELFVTLKAPFSQELVTIHADINAAQNLQRRFWNMNSELYRVACRTAQIGEQVVFVPTNSKTAEKHLGKGLFTKRSEDETDNVYKWDKQTKLRSKKTLPDDSLELEESEDFLGSMEEVKEVRGEFKTLFRDPSGFFFPKDFWRPQVEFWNIVKNKLEKRLKEKILQNC